MRYYFFYFIKNAHKHGVKSSQTMLPVWQHGGPHHSAHRLDIWTCSIWNVSNEAYHVWCQASTVKQMRTAFFWLITQRAVVIHYRRFGTGPIGCPKEFFWLIMEPVVVIPYRCFGTTLEDGTNRLSQRILLAYYGASSGISLQTFWDNPWRWDP